MLPLLHPGKLLLVMLVIAQAVVKPSPVVPTIGDGQAPPGVSGSNAPILPKRQATPKQLSQLTHIFSGTESTRTEVDKPEMQSLDTTPSLARKEPIHPSFFYSERGLYIRCNSPRYVYDLKPYLNPEYPDVYLFDWTDWTAKFDTVDDALKAIRGQQHHCTSCLCDDQGRIIRRGEGYSSCQGKKKALYCALMYACYCTVDLIQPVATSTSATVADYQNALDAIPWTAKAQNENYRWLWGGSSLTFSDTPLELADGRRVVPPRPDPFENEDTYGGMSMILDPDNGYAPPNRKRKWLAGRPGVGKQDGPAWE